MEVRPGYKQTEVGEIPEDWQVSTVAGEFEIQLGKMLDAEKNSGLSKPYLGNRAVQWDRIDIENLSTMAMSHADLERYRLRRGDLLVCEGGEVGRAAVWEAPIDDCYYQKALHRLRPLRDFDSRLMLALLRYWADQGFLSNYVTQTSIAHLTREKFADVPLPVPQATEQRVIADAIEDMNRLISGQDRLLAKKRDIKQATMQQLLAGRQRLPGFDGEWRTMTVGDIADVRTGPFGSALHESDYVSDGTPIITVEHLGEFGVTHTNLPKVSAADCRRLSAYSLRAGDIVFSRVGSIDRNARIREEEDGWLFSGRLLRVRLTEPSVLASFLSYLFHGETFRRRVADVAVGQTMASLNTGILAGIRIVVPSVDEQRDIAGVLSDMDAEIVALEQRREKTRALKQGMMQELLTGRTRLVDAPVQLAVANSASTGEREPVMTGGVSA